MPQIGEIRRAQEIGKGGRSLKYIWHACEGCGKERWVWICKGMPQSRHCSSCASNNKGRYGCKSHSWKGGRISNGFGYMLIHLYPNDFFFPMANKQGYVLEHRLVMAKHLTHCLLPWEIVHHINGIKDDNRIENLELLPARKYHLADSVLKSRLSCLETLIEKQSQKIKLLEQRITLLEVENVVLSLDVQGLRI